MPRKKPENYLKDPARLLAGLLRNCEWQPIKRGLWAKGQHRIEVDDMGIWLFRFHQGQWERIQGLAFADFKSQFITDQFIQFTDDTKLNLAGG